MFYKITIVLKSIEKKEKKKYTKSLTTNYNSTERQT